MTIVDGRFVSDSAEAILDVMVNDAIAEFGDSLPPEAVSVVRNLFKPVAEQLAELQNNMALVLDGAQIDHAEGQALDYLTALIGVPRNEARASTGTVTFSRATAAAQDYTVPKGTRVQTEGVNPVVFETTEQVTLLSGTTSIDASVKSLDGGSDQNVGVDMIIVMSESVSGVESVTNAAATTGGRDRENDADLRTRAKQGLASGARASAKGLIAAIRAIEDAKSVSIFVNDSDAVDADGLPAHSFELLVEGVDLDTAYRAEVAQAILDAKAAGDTSTSGVHGTATSDTAELVNGQSFTINFSYPTPTQIYVDVGISIFSDDYAGDSAVKDAIVKYIGGVLTSTDYANGKLSVGHDVLVGEVEYAIRSVAGVYDVTSLKIDTVNPPAGTTNVTIDYNQKAKADATDGSITVTTTAVSSPS